MAQVKESLHEQQDEMPLTVTDPDYEAWFRRKVARSIEAADNGQLLSSQEIEERAEARIKHTLEKFEALA